MSAEKHHTTFPATHHPSATLRNYATTINKSGRCPELQEGPDPPSPSCSHPASICHGVRLNDSERMTAQCVGQRRQTVTAVLEMIQQEPHGRQHQISFLAIQCPAADCDGAAKVCCCAMNQFLFLPVRK